MVITLTDGQSRFTKENRPMKILISGAGIAGTTLAYWLAQRGFQATVVERSAGLRSSGSPVDVRGPAVEVAARMGIMPRLRAAATDVTRLTFVNAAGRRVGRISMRAMQSTAGDREVEVPRGDLSTILRDATRDRAEFLWDDSIVALDQDDNGVNVTFDRAAPRRFDLVVGTDGLHSAVRRLSFGAETEFVRHMGIYVATLPIGTPAEDRHEVLMYNAPGTAVSVHPSTGQALAAFMFRSPAVPDYNHRDTAQHRRLLTTAFAGGAWRVPELLDRVRASDDLYFDSVSQVRLPEWSRGRVVLLGDAASCVSLFGDGSTLAMAGAATLADELAATPKDHGSALRRYEHSHRARVEPKQRNVSSAAAMLIPATRGGIHARNLALKLSPVATAAGSLRRRAVAAHG
jgi:2-polyprenyl-6-methoxyphenol hydroxylase-like FAD-dependent oxidoreductase